MKSKSVIVSGGSGLIGQKIVEDFLNNNYNVHVLDLEFSEALVKINNDNRDTCLLHVCDVTKYKSLKKIIRSYLFIVIQFLYDLRIQKLYLSFRYQIDYL